MAGVYYDPQDTTWLAPSVTLVPVSSKLSSTIPQLCQSQTPNASPLSTNPPPSSPSAIPSAPSSLASKRRSKQQPTRAQLPPRSRPVTLLVCLYNLSRHHRTSPGRHSQDQVHHRAQEQRRARRPEVWHSAHSNRSIQPFSHAIMTGINMSVKSTTPGNPCVSIRSDLIQSPSQPLAIYLSSHTTQVPDTDFNSAWYTLFSTNTQPNSIKTPSSWPNSPASHSQLASGHAQQYQAHTQSCTPSLPD